MTVHYVGRWAFGGIEVLTPPDDYPDMGFHIYMTGSACRSFEIYLTAQRIPVYPFFRLNFQNICDMITVSERCRHEANGWP